MAVAQQYTAIAGDTITAARWNNEFGNIYNNGTTLAFPATTNVSFNGKTVTWDAAGSATTSATTGVITLTGSLTISSALTVSGALAGTLAKPGAIFGLTLSNDGSDPTNDIDIAVGEASSVNTTPSSRVRLVLASALVKRLDASWVTGTNQGGLSSSLTITNTTYHVHLIRVAGVDDVGFDTSATAANLITDHTATAYRRIGSIIRTAGVIGTFVQDGEYFQRLVPVVDISAANPGTNAVTRTLSVPLGINVIWLGAMECGSTTGAFVITALITDLATTDTAPDGSGLSQFRTVSGFTNVPLAVRTNTSAQVRSRLAASDANTTLYMVTIGWIDFRGRQA